MIVDIKSKYIAEKVDLKFGYYENGSKAIQGFSLLGEPLFKATVALHELPSENCVFLKGWSENEGIPQALVKAGIVEFTGRKIKTGFCEAIEAQILITE